MRYVQIASSCPFRREYLFSLLQVSAGTYIVRQIGPKADGLHPRKAFEKLKSFLVILNRLMWNKRHSRCAGTFLSHQHIALVGNVPLGAKSYQAGTPVEFEVTGGFTFLTFPSSSPCFILF